MLANVKQLLRADAGNVAPFIAVDEVGRTARVADNEAFGAQDVGDASAPRQRRGDTEAAARRADRRSA